MFITLFSKGLIYLSNKKVLQILDSISKLYISECFTIFVNRVQYSRRADVIYIQAFLNRATKLSFDLFRPQSGNSITLPFGILQNITEYYRF
jgi:hypothetical protein